jgi:hypothetical protein
MAVRTRRETFLSSAHATTPAALAAVRLADVMGRGCGFGVFDAFILTVWQTYPDPIQMAISARARQEGLHSRHLPRRVLPKSSGHLRIAAAVPNTREAV